MCRRYLAWPLDHQYADAVVTEQNLVGFNRSSVSNGKFRFTLVETESHTRILIDTQQGVSWLVRQAIKWSTITLHVKEYKDEAGNVHIDIQQISSGGYSNDEERILDWVFREKDDKVFGKVNGRTRWVSVDDVDEPYLKAGWDQKFLDDWKGEVIQSFVESVKSPQWTADQTWGFEIIKGERRYVRHVFAKKGKEEHRIKLVYDWKD